MDSSPSSTLTELVAILGEELLEVVALISRAHGTANRVAALQEGLADVRGDESGSAADEDLRVVRRKAGQSEMPA